MEHIKYIKEIGKNVYGLKSTGLRVFIELWTFPLGSLNVLDLVKLTGKDRTTIQKIITKFDKELKILKKEQINLHRGFKFTYILDYSRIVEDIDNKINDFERMKTNMLER